MNESRSYRRLRTEYAELQKNNSPSCSASPSDDNFYRWDGVIYGPEDTPYQGGVFHLDIIIPEEYPFKPPKITFLTKIYHCNINSSGNICLDILKNNWSPALTISKVLLSISSLLAEPNPKDPLVADIADLYIHNRVVHDDIARKWTVKYAG